MRSGLEPRSAQPNNSQQCIRTGRCISTTVAVVAARPTTLTFEQACLMAGFGKSADADDSWKSSVIVLSTRQPSTYTRTWNPSAQLSCGSVSSSAQPLPCVKGCAPYGVGGGGGDGGGGCGGCGGGGRRHGWTTGSITSQYSQRASAIVKHHGRRSPSGLRQKLWPPSPASGNLLTA